MDGDVLAERILLDLKNTFKKDPLIDEFDILPVHESLRNKCPVIHIDHKVALEDWCVKHVYVYAYTNFFAWRKKPYKIDPDCLLTWSCAILLINPEIETVWNVRKELVCQNSLFPEDELKFSEVVLSWKPKSSPVYAHRKWVLLELKKSSHSPCSLQHIITHEFSLCTRSANIYANNYYAWCHRSWILKEFYNNCLKIVFEELIQTERWISTHISDHCGFHYRQFLISCCSPEVRSKSAIICPFHVTHSSPEGNHPCSSINKTKLFVDELQQELLLLCSLQTTYPGHETLWCHRRYILTEFHRISLSGFTTDSRREDSFSDGNSARYKLHKLECNSRSDSEWDSVKEIHFLKDHMLLNKNNEWEKTLILRHVKWLKVVLSWQVIVPFC